MQPRVFAQFHLFGVWIGLALLNAVVPPAMLWSGQAEAKQSDVVRFSAESRLVSMDVLVLDKKTGARIDRLNREDFLVYDDGRPQVLTHFLNASDARRPLALVLVVDLQGINAYVAEFAASVGPVLQRLQTEDEVAVIVTNGTEVEVVENFTQARGQVLARFVEKARQLGAPGRPKKERLNGGLFTPAIDVALGRLGERPANMQPAVVAFTTDLTGSNDWERYNAYVETRRHLLAGGATVSGVINVYSRAQALGLAGGRALTKRVSVKPPVILLPVHRYSIDSGGEIADVGGLDYGAALERVIGNLRGRYSLGFVPDASRLDGKIHSLTVRVVVPKEKGRTRELTIHARQAYQGDKPAS